MLSPRLVTKAPSILASFNKLSNFFVSIPSASSSLAAFGVADPPDNSGYAKVQSKSSDCLSNADHVKTSASTIIPAVKIAEAKGQC